MPDSLEHHTRQLRQAIVLGGRVEIHEPGCDSPTEILAQEVYTMRLPLGGGFQHIERCRILALLGGTDLEASPERAADRARDYSTAVLGAWAQHFVKLEKGGGQVSYRGRA